MMKLCELQILLTLELKMHGAKKRDTILNEFLMYSTRQRRTLMKRFKILSKKQLHLWIILQISKRHTLMSHLPFKKQPKIEILLIFSKRQKAVRLLSLSSIIQIKSRVNNLQSHFQSRSIKNLKTYRKRIILWNIDKILIMISLRSQLNRTSITTSKTKNLLIR